MSLFPHSGMAKHIEENSTPNIIALKKLVCLSIVIQKIQGYGAHKAIHRLSTQEVNLLILIDNGPLSSDRVANHIKEIDSLKIQCLYLL